LDGQTEAARRAIWDDDTSEAETSSTGEIAAVSEEERAARFGQKPATILLTGLTGSGKTAVAAACERKLFDAGRAVAMIDGERVRKGLSRDLSFTAEDRNENLRRSAHLAHALNDAGVICIAAFVAPNEAARQRAGALVGAERFLTVHVATPIDICRQRDTKGQYAEADAGRLPNFPGVTAPYEDPDAPDLAIDPATDSIDACADAIIELLRSKGFIR